VFNRRLLVGITAGVFASGLALWAADAWVKKPYTEWNEKDIRQIMTESPWALGVSVKWEFRGGTFPLRPTAPRDQPGIAETAAPNATAPIGAAPPLSQPPPRGGWPETLVRWQSSLAVQQALVKMEYGEKAGSSPEAQKRLAANSAYYVIAVANLPVAQQPRDDEERKTMLRSTTLTVPGKDHAIVASDMVFVSGTDGWGLGDARFLFPRDFDLTVEDKEAEFATKFGKTKVRARFNLRSMVINGALGL
jgi:hypothetical protein